MKIFLECLDTLEFLATGYVPSLAQRSNNWQISLRFFSRNRSGRKNSIEVFNSRAENRRCMKPEGSYLNAILEIDGGRVQLIRLDQTSPQQLVGCSSYVGPNIPSYWQHVGKSATYKVTLRPFASTFRCWKNQYRMVTAYKVIPILPVTLKSNMLVMNPLPLLKKLIQFS